MDYFFQMSFYFSSYILIFTPAEFCLDQNDGVNANIKC